MDFVHTCMSVGVFVTIIYYSRFTLVLVDRKLALPHPSFYPNLKTKQMVKERTALIGVSTKVLTYNF
jgi:hypothetical protein